MKHIEEDLAMWRSQQKNQAKSVPYEFPKMPPRFRVCCTFTKILFLFERGGIILLFLGILTVCLLGWLKLDERILSCLSWVVLASPCLWMLCKLLRRTSKFFWHCPQCGTPFPYYAPPLRGQDELKEADCFYEMERLQIRWVQPRFCPLVVPSVCPVCRAKFFELRDT